MEKEYNKYLWSPKQPRVYGISPLTISGTPMSEEDVATSLKVENSQQRFQQNPVVKRSEQWEAQQKQREEEIAASKKWLELHPEDESDSPYTILERGKHQAIVDGKDPSYYEKMIDDGKQFTKGALSVLSLPYLSAAAVGAYGYGASLGARGLFAAQGIHGLANENGVRKTANLIKSGDYGRAALSGAGDALNAAMVLPGAKFLGSAAKYGLKTTYVADRLANNVRNVTLPYNIYGNDSRRPLSQFIDSNRNGDSNSYWLRTYKYDKHTGKPLDIRNLDGAKFGDGGYGNDGGKIDGTFMSYGEPWQEFAVTPRDAWYKFPNRSSERSATNWKGDKMGYSVKDAYDAELAYRKVGDFMGSIPENTDPYEMGKMRLFEKSKYPILKKIPQAGDRYFANQTVIPKHELTYDSFLKRPFWKYTEDPISGQVQQELFMQWPKNNTQGRTYLGLLERPSKLSEAERLDVPKDLSPNISRSLGFSSTTGEELFTPNEILGEFVSGKNQAAKFFQQPVVQNSYAHNKELANRLGINIADRPENISEIVGAPIKLSPYIQNPGNELANIAQSYLGDPSATLSIAWTPFSKRVAKLTGIHEGLHRGHYAQVIKPAPPITKNYYETTMRPEATFWNWKINKLLKPEYQNGYLGGPFDGEAGVNLIEMGRDMGVKLGTKYPGDEVFMNMINNYNGHKSFLIPHLDLNTRAGRRHVWDAMTGQYFKQGGILKRVESGKSGIHIKPENRGKFTALKKRTGKSSTWYKEHGTPAQKKMAVFALNAKKWKHK